MKLYELGVLPRFDSMLIFHAMAYLGQEAFILVSPQEPIVTLGYFQDQKTAVDLEFCRQNKIGVMRREVGGGTTLLDNNQIFFQIVLRKDNPLAQGDFLQIYRKFSQPVIDAYNDLGIKVKFKEVNDLLTVDGERKITGEGGANIGECVVFVGGILMDFDYETMSRVFPVQNEEYRAQLLQSLRGNVTSIKKELGTIPARKDIEGHLLKHFEKIFGVFELAPIKEEIWAKARELEKIYTSDEFINKKGRSTDSVKIASGVNVTENRYKAVGGTIHSMAEIKNGSFSRVNLHGDFTFIPKEKLVELEQGLQGVNIERQKVLEAVTDFFNRNTINCPGVTPEDFMKALLPDRSR